jgi:hypothetical protein
MDVLLLENKDLVALQHPLGQKIQGCCIFGQCCLEQCREDHSVDRAALAHIVRPAKIYWRVAGRVLNSVLVQGHRIRTELRRAGQACDAYTMRKMVLDTETMICAHGACQARWRVLQQALVTAGSSRRSCTSPALLAMARMKYGFVGGGSVRAAIRQGLRRCGMP